MVGSRKEVLCAIGKEGDAYVWTEYARLELFIYLSNRRILQYINICDTEINTDACINEYVESENGNSLM